MNTGQLYEAYVKTCIKAHVEPLNPRLWLNVGAPSDPRIAQQRYLLTLAAAQNATEAAYQANDNNLDAVLAGSGEEQNTDTCAPVNNTYDDPLKPVNNTYDYPLTPVNNTYDDPRNVPDSPEANTITIKQWQRAWEYRIHLGAAFRSIINK